MKNLHFIDEPQENPRKVARMLSLTKPEINMISKDQFLRLINMESAEKVSTDRNKRFITNPIQIRTQLEKLVMDVAVNENIWIGEWIAIESESGIYSIGQVSRFKKVFEERCKEDRIIRSDYVS